jgi:putative sigma-54 modulation protein
MMNFIITGRKVEVTDGLRERIHKRLGKLDKYFKDDPEVRVTLSVAKDRHTIEVTIYSRGVIYRAEDTDTDMYAAIDKVVDVIERQMRRHKTHLEKKLKKEAFDIPYMDLDEKEESVAEESEFNVVKVKKFTFKPMSVEEAILQMNLLGHQFFVFDNAETEAVSIVYKRKDGNYALIERADK